MLRFLVFLLFSSSLSANSCVVLMYHHFAKDTPKSTSISLELFTKHLEYLSQNNFNVLSLKTMLTRLENKNLPEKCVVLTADDAHKSIYKTAYPLLKKYQMKMAVFVNTLAVDNNYKKSMSWQQMRSIKGENIEFYNHSASHSHFLDLDENAIKKDIEQAQNRLKQELKVSSKILSYPYGEANLAIYNQLKQMGYIAFGQHSGALSYDTNLQNLPRFPMNNYFAKMKSFKTKVNTLALPIISQKINPIIDDNNNPPLLNLTFKKPLTKSQKANFNCFTKDGTNINWNHNKVSIIAKKPLKARRNKYNCTMPSEKRNKYYWFSVQWINPNLPE